MESERVVMAPSCIPHGGLEPVLWLLSAGPMVRPGVD